MPQVPQVTLDQQVNLDSPGQMDSRAHSDLLDHLETRALLVQVELLDFQDQLDL